MLVGPNTGLGHNSIIYRIEAQVRYVMEALKFMRQRKLADDTREFDAKSYRRVRAA